MASQLPSSHFSQLSGQPLGNLFSHIQAMVRRSWKRVLGNMDARSRPCDRLSTTAVLCTSGKHPFECAVFSYTSPDGFCLGEIDRPNCETVGNI